MHIFSVTELNQFVKALLDGVPQLQEVCVRGELSNYKIYPSGHHYFTLKDPEGALRCVMFKGSAARLRFRPENGMKVVVTGRITVFPRDGAYQLYCNTMMPEGAGRSIFVASPSRNLMQSATPALRALAMARETQEGSESEPRI